MESKTSGLLKILLRVQNDIGELTLYLLNNSEFVNGNKLAIV